MALAGALVLIAAASLGLNSDPTGLEAIALWVMGGLGALAFLEQTV